MSKIKIKWDHPLPDVFRFLLNGKWIGGCYGNPTLKRWYASHGRSVHKTPIAAKRAVEKYFGVHP